MCSSCRCSKARSRPHLLEGLGEATVAGRHSAPSSAKEFQAKPYELFILPVVSGWRAARVALIGCGRTDDASSSGCVGWPAPRRWPPGSGASGASRSSIADWRVAPTRPRRSRRDSSWRATAATATRAASGAVRRRSSAVVVETVAPATRRHSSSAVERGRILGESCNIARDLCNEPSNVLTPSVFADRAAAIGRERRARRSQILDEDELARLGMGLLLGVGRGSAEPPRMIVLRHDPPGAPAAPVLGLVGKGITFDTGGISIKPADGMEKMKDDMAGGAAVDLRDARDRAAEGAHPRHRRRPGGREHAGRPGDQAGRRADRRQREDRRGHQHRRRGPADPRRRSLVRAAARRHAPGRRRDAHRRLRRRARPGCVGALRSA